MASAPPGPIRCRPIRPDDLPGVTALLGRGFPERPAAFWQRGFERMSGLSDEPRFGFLLQSDAGIVGVLLAVADPRFGPGERRIGLSSWYVEPAYAAMAALLDVRATNEKGATFVNISAAPHTRPTIEARGFRPYASGFALTVPLLARRGAPAGTRLHPGDRPPAGAKEADRALVADHLRFGCLCAWVELAGAALPFCFARRNPAGGFLPNAHLIYGPSVEDFVRFARPLGCFLLRHGLPAVAVDANAPVPRLPGPFLARGPKYAKGPAPPRLGDIAYSEAVLFGTMRSDGSM